MFFNAKGINVILMQYAMEIIDKEDLEKSLKLEKL
jgi:hypothetical protein